VEKGNVGLGVSSTSNLRGIFRFKVKFRDVVMDGVRRRYFWLRSWSFHINEK